MRPGIVPSVWLRGVPRDVAHSFVQEETRQEYATARIQELQRPGMNPSFDVLLTAFRMYGALYDRGDRLRICRAVA